MGKAFYKSYPPLWFGVAAGILYGVLIRLAYSNYPFGDFFGVMTIGFIFLVPVALGVLTVYYGNPAPPRRWAYRICAPWVPVMALMAAAFLIGWEGTICLLMAMPVFLFMSSLGGIITGIILDRRKTRQNFSPMLIFFAALPFASSSVENQFQLPQSTREVRTQITINASPQTVWRHIERVRAIQPDELKRSVFHSLGFPRPIEATLSYEGVGGVRHATFEGGVLFVETITRWEPEHELTFDIKADTASIPPTTLDEHVTIGGPYFDVLEGGYRIEPLNDRQVVLHLTSKERLSTRFNFYSGWWTDYVMRDIQDSILEVIKKRCEAGE